MRKTFVAEREDRPGTAWLARFTAGRDEACRWYLGESSAKVPTAAACRTALRQHMPELLPHYDAVCSLVGDDDVAHRILSHYRPPPLPHGCSQAVWLGEQGPALVRNYDFSLDLVSDRIELTAWSGRRVIAKAQRPWGGCLDGMNEDGLVVSLTRAGGGRGRGFAVILMLRYVLETCRTVDDAVAALSRIPIAQGQNITLLDRTGAYATLFLGPDRDPHVTHARVCTNHQEQAREGTDSNLRYRVLIEALSTPGINLSDLTDQFLKSPLYVRRPGFTTVYTAVYRPLEGQVEFLWPGRRWVQGFDRFEAGSYTHAYDAGSLADL